MLKIQCAELGFALLSNLFICNFYNIFWYLTKIFAQTRPVNWWLLKIRKTKYVYKLSVSITYFFLIV